MKMSSAHTEKGEAMTREKAIEIIIELVSNWQAEYTLNDLELRALEMAIEALSVDIRCRECKHWDGSYIEEPIYLQRYCDKRREYVFDYEHCGNGERRSDE